MSSFACTWGYDDFRQSWPACWVKLIWEYQLSVGGVNIREEKEEAFVWVLWVCLSSSVTSDRQCVNTVLSYLCLCMEKRRRQPFEEKFCFTSACFFSLSWNRISYTDKQTPTHHSYYGCLISVAQDSLLSMWPKKHMGWCVAGSLSAFNEWCKMCNMFLTGIKLTHISLLFSECSCLTVSWHHNVLQLRNCTVNTAVIHMSCSAVLSWRAVVVPRSDAGLWLPVSARHAYSADHPHGNLACIRFT